MADRQAGSLIGAAGMAVPSTVADRSPEAGHLVRLPAGAWALWRCVGLRSAGFPISQVLGLAREECAAAADALPEPPARGAEPEGWGRYREQFGAAVMSLSAQLREVLTDPRFREALIWQNRSAWHTGIGNFASGPDGKPRGTMVRRNEEGVARYLQRYCAKNDVIGFFGPIGWARWAEGAEPVSMRPGAGLLAARRTSFEVWAIDALGEALARDGSLRPWIPPRRMPFVHLEGRLLYRPYTRPLQLTETEADALRLCDGERTAANLVDRLASTRPAWTRDDGYRLLRSLEARGLLAWTLEVPLQLEPDRVLRRRLERIGDLRLRARALATLGRLEAGRAAVAEAAGNPDRVDLALAGLERVFSEVTGAAPTRLAGQTYAARTLVYEDCRRDLDLALGRPVLEAVAQPLSLLLTSARWYTFELAARYRMEFADVYRQCVAATGSPVVELAQRAFFSLLDRIPGPVDAVQDEFERRWSTVLALPPGSRRVTHRSDRLAQRVKEAFAAPRAGWAMARYHSPDLLIAAPSLEAIREGNFEPVLGELHMACNSLQTACTMAQHPRPEEIFEALERDLPEPLVIPVAAKHWPRMTTRTHTPFRSPKDFYLSLGPNAGGFPPTQSLPIAALVLDPQGGGRVARTRDGSHRFDVVELFGLLFSAMIVTRFRLLGPAPHLPRVTVDRLVISRETWTFPPSTAGFAFTPDEAHRFVQARRWARELGLPRFVFVRTPVEVKPVFVDFSSPVSVNILAKLVRRLLAGGAPDALVTLTEMLPEPGQAWLCDRDGDRYVSEFRLVALDLA